MARTREVQSPAEAEIARIRKSHRSLLVTITSLAAPREAAIADVDSIDALVALAKAYELKILEQPAPGAATYLVWDNGLIYRYRVGNVPEAIIPVSTVGPPAYRHRTAGEKSPPTWVRLAEDQPDEQAQP